MAKYRYQKAVKYHTERGGVDSHWEERENGKREKITYALFDCTYCGEEAIASKADFDTWSEVWPSVEKHLKDKHPIQLQQDSSP